MNFSGIFCLFLGDLFFSVLFAAVGAVFEVVGE
jgi:hypothetical protein